MRKSIPGPDLLNQKCNPLIIPTCRSSVQYIQLCYQDPGSGIVQYLVLHLPKKQYQEPKSCISNALKPPAVTPKPILSLIPLFTLA